MKEALRPTLWRCLGRCLGRGRVSPIRSLLCQMCMPGLWAVVWLLTIGPAASRGDAEWTSRVGFDGVYRCGSWTPLVLESTQSEAAVVTVWVEDPDGQLVGSPAAEVVTLGDGTRQARVRVRFGRPAGRVLVEDDSQGLTALQLQPPLESTERVLLVVGDLPSAERASRLLQREDGARLRVVTVADPARLGSDGLDYDGADAIIVCGRTVSAAPPTAAALRGMDAWVRRGGRLVFIAGASAVQPALSASAAAAWLPGPPGKPGSVARMVPLRRAAAIETYCKAGRPLDRGALAGLEVPLLADPAGIDGAIEAWEGNSPTDLPLVVRRAHGFGSVTWIGLDIDQGAFRNWQGTDSLLVELLGGRPAKAGRAGEVSRQTLDLGGQLRLAVDRFPGVVAVPFEIIAGMALLYIGCLYPLDWWLVSRGGGRPRLAWLTLPLLVAAFTGLAWWTAGRWKGNRWQASRADIVDIDIAAGIARGTSFAGVWSPDNALLDISVTVPQGYAARPGDSAVSWYGISGRGIGATDASTAHPSLAADSYGYQGSAERLAGVPIAASSSRLFEAEWMADEVAKAVVSSLTADVQGTLRGSLESRLPFPLEQCGLLHAGWYYEIGTLAPGGRFVPAAGKGPRTLAAALTRSASVFDRVRTERWSLEETDIDRILEMAGFHAAAGGEAYTSLEAGRLGRIDLSPLLQIDRAVLVGRGPSGTVWGRSATAEDGRTIPDQFIPSADTSTLWRIVIPLDHRRP